MTGAEPKDRAAPPGGPEIVTPGPVDAGTARADAGAARAAEPSDPARRRPILERIGMAGIALVLAALFGAVAAAAFGGGEPFLGAMAAVGCLMTVWVGARTLLRG